MIFVKKSKNLPEKIIYFEFMKNAYNIIYKFPKEYVSYDDRVIIYGAGHVGKDYYTQNANEGYCNVVAWVDRDYENFRLPIVGTDILYTSEYNKIIIAIENPKIASAIKKELTENGISDEKIFCAYL